MTGQLLAPMPAQQFLLDGAERDLRRWVRKMNAWWRHVRRVRDGEVEMKPRLLPSKTSKYRAYEAAGRICLILGIEDRPHDFPSLCALVGEPCDLQVRILDYEVTEARWRAVRAERVVAL